MDFNEWWKRFCVENNPTIYWLESEEFCARAAWNAAQQQTDPETMIRICGQYMRDSKERINWDA